MAEFSFSRIQPLAFVLFFWESPQIGHLKFALYGALAFTANLSNRVDKIPVNFKSVTFIKNSDVVIQLLGLLYTNGAGCQVLFTEIVHY